MIRTAVVLYDASKFSFYLDARVTPETIFNIAEVGGGLVTYGLAILLFHLPRPRRLLIRGGVAVATSWVVGIAYTAFVYNPAGITAARATGLHFPEGHFDNNTIAVALVGGWIGPAIILAIMGAFRAMREDVGLRSYTRPPNISLDRCVTSKVPTPKLSGDSREVRK